MKVVVALIDGSGEILSYEPGAERFVILDGGAISLDQQGLYDYAVSRGLCDSQTLNIAVIESIWLILTSTYYSICGGFRFTVAELLTENMRVPYYDDGFKVWNLFYKCL